MQNCGNCHSMNVAIDSVSSQVQGGRVALPSTMRNAMTLKASPEGKSRSYSKKRNDVEQKMADSCNVYSGAVLS